MPRLYHQTPVRVGAGSREGGPSPGTSPRGQTACGCCARLGERAGEPSPERLRRAPTRGTESRVSNDGSPRHELQARPISTGYMSAPRLRDPVEARGEGQPHGRDGDDGRAKRGQHAGVRGRADSGGARMVSRTPPVPTINNVANARPAAWRRSQARRLAMALGWPCRPRRQRVQPAGGAERAACGRHVPHQRSQRDGHQSRHRAGGRT